jgi:hypothetical protein
MLQGEARIELKLHFSGGKTVAEDYLEIIIVQQTKDQRSIF